MDVRTEVVQQILTMLTQKSGQPLDRYGLREIAIEVNEYNKKDYKKGDRGMSDYYIYRSMYQGHQNAAKENKEAIPLQDVQLHRISRYLNFDNTTLLLNHIAPPVDAVLLSCIGNYYSYLRRNSEDAFILRSPVSIGLQQNRMMFSLAGPVRKYTGEISLANGCLFILMEHDDGKQFHHIYQVGQHKAPKVLQGIFSGVSTVFAPIGGRAVLIRATDDYTAWENKEIDMEAMRKSKDLTERRLAEYFDGYGENNLNIKRVSTFRVDDLGKCK